MHLTGVEMGTTFTKPLVQEVLYNDVTPDVYRHSSSKNGRPSSR